MTSPETPSVPDLGRAVAHLLTGCWRSKPLPVVLERAQLDALLPAVIGSGAGALAWRRLRHSELAGEPAALTLRALHFKQALDTRLQQREIVRLWEKLRKEGVESLLVKGWATARVYPEAGMRASGDIDLLIRPADKLAAGRALGEGIVDENHPVWDIKTRVPALYRLSAATLFERQTRVMLDETEIATLSAEDHLRILCLHFLKHGAWRPLWLCDIAAALEFRPPNFHWETCLGDDPRTADSVACALGLAHQILGAFVDETPVEPRAKQLPRWLVPAVLKVWNTPQVDQNQPNPFLKDTLRERKGVFQALIKRWPNPIQAAMERETSLDVPPYLVQSAYLGARCVTFLQRLPRSLRS